MQDEFIQLIMNICLLVISKLSRLYYTLVYILMVSIAPWARHNNHHPETYYIRPHYSTLFKGILSSYKPSKGLLKIFIIHKPNISIPITHRPITIMHGHIMMTYSFNFNLRLKPISSGENKRIPSN